MGDTIANASIGNAARTAQVAAAEQKVLKPESKEIDKSNWEWVIIPAEDVFGDSNTGVSLNFTKYTPELDDMGNPTGKDGRYFLDPETAGEVRRLLSLVQKGQLRVFQPNADKKMIEIMNRGSKHGAPTNANADNPALYR